MQFQLGSTNSLEDRDCCHSSVSCSSRPMESLPSESCTHALTARIHSRVYSSACISRGNK
jgi:hypothetical protein